MSSYWDNEIVRVALPKVYPNQHEAKTNRALWFKGLADGLERNIEAAEEQLKMIREMQREAEGRICMGCYGTRKIRIQDDMDSSHLEICPTCKGSGEPDGS